MPETLCISLFGPFAVQLAQGPIRLPTRKSQWILGLLALRCGRDVDRAWLAGTLWPDSEEPQALYNLRRELSALRRALGDAACIESNGMQSIRLDSSRTSVDVHQFDSLVGRRDPESLRQAVDLYCGPLLEGCAEDWALPERMAREQAYVLALEKLAELEVEDSPLQAASRYQAAIAADAFRESAYRGLMTALDRAGSPLEAVQVYRDLRSLLRAEMNAEPSPDTTALYRAIREKPRNPPPTKSQRPRRDRIPQPITRLIGREELARQVISDLRSHRLVSLVGTAGVGKTRLAIEVAQRVRDEFPDGAAFVELAALRDPTLIPQAVSVILGLRDDSEQAATDALVTFLSGRSLLLVLDNCEHLVEACAGLAAELLKACPDLLILATSRQSLGVTGEFSVRVPALPAPPDGYDPGPHSLTDFAAAELFIERATAARAAGLDAQRDALAIARICRRLEGIPLAIELAAARTKALSIRQIADRLDDALSLLTDGDRSAEPRQRALRAALDWSHSLLDAEEVVLLARLSVFRGGFTLEAAESVCADAKIPRGIISRHLEGLVDKSLVVFEDGPTESRYRLLETVRDYARERLQERQESEVMRDAHLAYYLSLSEIAEPFIFGAIADREWIARMDVEVDNIRSALDWRRQEPNHKDKALRIIGALHWLWFATRRIREAREIADSVLGWPGISAPVHQAKGLMALAVACFWQGDFAAMEEPASKALGLLSEDDPNWLRGYAHILYGGAFTCTGNPTRGLPLHEEAVLLMRKDGRPAMQAFSLWWLCLTLQHLGDLAGARAASEEGCYLGEKGGSLPAIAHHTSMLGRIFEALRDLESAERRYIAGLRAMQQMDDAWGAANALEGLMRVNLARGRGECAAVLFGAADALRNEVGSPVPRYQRAAHDATLAAMADVLDARTFSSAVDRGRSMRLGEVVTFAESHTVR